MEIVYLIAGFIFTACITSGLANGGDKTIFNYTGPRGVPTIPPPTALVVAGNIDHCLVNDANSEDYCIKWAGRRNKIPPSKSI
jgi:hypothetical protein